VPRAAWRCLGHHLLAPPDLNQSGRRGESERLRRRDGKEERKRKEKRNGPGKIMENRK
jgi:hypothetical protein